VSIDLRQTETKTIAVLAYILHTSSHRLRID